MSTSNRFMLLAALCGQILAWPNASLAVKPPSTSAELQLTWLPAATHNREPRLAKVLVLHYTVSSLAETLSHFVDGRVSAHYTVDRNGDLYQHVDESEAAHHAGLSFWRRASVNSASIGVEIVNKGHLGTCDSGQDTSKSGCSGGLLWEPFPEIQKGQVIALCQDILRRNAIDPFDVVGHADIAPSRREDPGPLFFWSDLARAGVGVAYDRQQAALVHGIDLFPVRSPCNRSIQALQQTLFSLGYNIPVGATWDQPTRDAVRAFNAHYLGFFDDTATEETWAVAEALLRWQHERRTSALLSQY